MTRPVTAGLDGSQESSAAAHWAAREARWRGVPLRLVNAWSGEPELPASGEAAWRDWAGHQLRATRAELAARYPDLTVDAEQISGIPAAVLLKEAEGAQVLALGSREVGSVAGFVLGSTGLDLAATVGTALVLVRAGSDDDAQGAVVVGIALRRPCDKLLEFAFSAAARRGGVLCAVHASRIPEVMNRAPWLGDATLRHTREGSVRALGAALKPWRARFPGVRVTEAIASGSPSRRLVDAASGAAMLVVGRRPHPPGMAAGTGPVLLAVMHHSACPVAIVPHE